MKSQQTGQNFHQFTNLKTMGMKKVVIMMAAVLMLCGCEKAVFDEFAEEGAEAAIDAPTKKFTFTVKGDFGAATFTRGYLQADGQSMSDLWVYDFMDGVCVQSVHQTASDSDWGQPQMSLQYGSHHIYFVASRGDEPTVNTTDHTIVWNIPRDTFWKDYEVTVVNTSNGNRAVTLDRVATKLRLTVTDEVPTGCASVTVTPNTWYYGIDYMTGDAISAQKKDRVVQVPSSYIGTTGQLVVNIFGLSGTNEWTTSVSVQAKNAGGDVIGSATISGAPFERNRATEYSGSLFASGGTLDISVNADWKTSYSGTW